MLTQLMTCLTQNTSPPSVQFPETVFVNDEFVCKGTISCKSMYLTLESSLIHKASVLGKQMVYK